MNEDMPSQVYPHNKKIHKKDKKFYISLYIFYIKK